MKNLFLSVIAVGLSMPAFAAGLSINLPLVGRVAGGGGTLFLTAVDVANNGSSRISVDWYFDGKNATTGQAVSASGSIGDAGLSASHGSTMAPTTIQHFEDFVDAMVQSGAIPASFRDQGVTGSALLVFNGYDTEGQGAAAARFYNALGGGFVGVALGGHVISVNEPRKLVTTIRDTRGNPSASQTYPNVFINNTGLTPTGAHTADDVTVHLTAVSGRTGQAVGTPIDVTIGSGQTATVGMTFQALNIPIATEDRVLLYATVTSGSAAIEGLVSQVDPVTKDGSAFEMSRADF